MMFLAGLLIGWIIGIITIVAVACIVAAEIRRIKKLSEIFRTLIKMYLRKLQVFVWR
mgnify:CR=1 FL=1